MSSRGSLGSPAREKEEEGGTGLPEESVSMCCSRKVATLRCLGGGCSSAGPQDWASRWWSSQRLFASVILKPSGEGCLKRPAKRVSLVRSLVECGGRNDDLWSTQRWRESIGSIESGKGSTSKLCRVGGDDGGGKTARTELLALLVIIESVEFSTASSAAQSHRHVRYQFISALPSHHTSHTLLSHVSAVHHISRFQPCSLGRSK